MPIKLKRALQIAALPQRQWCAAVLQHDGTPLSAPAGHDILNRDNWPKRTPKKWLQQQTEQLLRDRGITEDVIAQVWDHDEDDLGRMQHPVGVHTLQHQRIAAQAAFDDNDFHLEPEMLSEKARKQFKIHRDPFIDDISEQKDVFLSDDFRYIRQAMYHTAIHGGTTAVVGEVGSGKTTLFHELEDRLHAENKAVICIFPRTLDKKTLSAEHIFEAIIRELNPSVKMRRTKEGRASQAEELLTESLDAGNQHLLVIDEAQDLTERMLKILKRFREIQKRYKKLMSILLLGQPELGLMLNAKSRPGAREFIERCDKVTVPPLDEMLGDYLKHKFARVGVDVNTIIDPKAYDAMRLKLRKGDKEKRTAVSAVYPLAVNNLVKKAMNVCAELGAPRIVPEVLEDL